MVHIFANKAKIKIRSLSVSLRKGTIKLKGVILPSPRMELYNWGSADMLRVGEIHVQFSLLSFLPEKFLGHRAGEIYSVVVKDVDVFVEKRGAVINFMLLDDSLDFTTCSGPEFVSAKVSSPASTSQSTPANPSQLQAGAGDHHQSVSNSLNQTKKAPLQELKGFFQRAGNEIGRNFKDMSRTAVKTAENTVIKPMRRESYVKKKKKSSDLYRIGYISLVNIKVTKAPSKSMLSISS